MSVGNHLKVSPSTEGASYAALDQQAFRLVKFEPTQGIPELAHQLTAKGVFSLRPIKGERVYTWDACLGFDACLVFRDGC